MSCDDEMPEAVQKSDLARSARSKFRYEDQYNEELTDKVGRET